ncbi:MAG: glycerophosphodiester phosphodiesterase family protein [Christensenella sp.]
MIWIVLAIICAVITIFYFNMTAVRPVPSWLKEYQYAHRGLHTAEYPENSMPAFKSAMENGYAIELDVHLSKDGVLMVFHDDDMERMTGAQGRIEDFTVDELKQRRLASSEYQIPTLDEVLYLVDGGTPLLIELKNMGRAGKLEVELYNRMKEYAGKFAIQSFSPFSVRWFYKNAPNILRGQLSATFYCGAEAIPRWQRWTLRHLLTNVMCRPNFINYEQSGVRRCVIKRLRRAGLPILAWTVRTREQQAEIQPFVDALVFENMIPGEKQDA